MLYALIGSLALAGTAIGALIALGWHWRADVKALQESADHIYQLKASVSILESNNAELRRRLLQSTETLRAEIARGYERDRKIALEAPASAVADTLRMRLQQPLKENAAPRAGATASGVLPTDVTGAASARAEAQPGSKSDDRLD